jgi:SAM-dependent methyltransferase
MSPEDSAIQLRVLETLEQAKNYNDWIAGLAAPYLGEHPLEVGSGLGSFAEIFLDSGVPRLTVSELEEAGVGRLRARFADEPRVEVARIDLAGRPNGVDGFSAVVAINVLEHIEDDVAALATMRSLARTGGAVIVFVPAHAYAMSKFDRSIGHFRRYSRERLVRAFEAAGLSVEQIQYVNSLGLVAWFVVMKVLRRTPDSQRLVQPYDRVVVPAIRRVERRFSPPFGQSLFAVGRA